MLAHVHDGKGLLCGISGVPLLLFRTRTAERGIRRVPVVTPVVYSIPKGNLGGHIYIS